MKKVVFPLLCLLICTAAEAQKYEFGKVSDEEIRQTKHHFDPEASAAILYKNGKVKMKYENGWKYEYTFEARVKIYNLEGYDYATIEVPLYRTGSGENEILSNLKGFTHNIEGGKSVKERLRNSDIFDEDVNEFWNYKKITFPNVKEGSVLEYTYIIKSPYIVSLPAFEFQDQIPVNFAEYSLDIPEYFGYKTFTKGFLHLDRDIKSERGGINFAYVPSNTSGSSGLNSFKTHYTTQTVIFNKSKYSVIDAPKVIQEDYMNNFKNYITSVRAELEWSKTPGNDFKNYATTWDDIAKNIFKNKKFGDDLNSEKYFENELNSVLNTSNNTIEKASAIFDFVKNKMNWNGIYGIYTQKGVKNAFINRTGNVADINLMLVAMMRYANINASPVLVSTKSNGVPIFPTRTGFNYVICAAEINNEIILFDATNKHSAPNILPERALNWFGRLIKNEAHIQEINLLPENNSKRTVIMEININENGSVNGKYRQALTDQHAFNFRNNHASKAESVYLNELEKKLGDFEIIDYSIQNKNDVYKPLIESYSFTKENAFDILGGKFYISPLLFETHLKNPFTAENRIYPIDFSFPKSHSYMVSINIPEGHKVESIPESVTYQLPDGLGDFTFMISNTDNALQLRLIQNINDVLVIADYYKVLKEFFGDIIAKQAEKIILSKI